MTVAGEVSPSTATCDTCIVVPCYNEALRLDVVQFATWVKANPSFRLCMVDDGSSDGTLKVLNKLKEAAGEGVQVLALETNSGKAEAVRSGLRAAITDPRIKYAGYFDADLATPLRDLTAFRVELDETSDIDIILAARVQLLGREIVRTPARHYLGRCFATVAAMALGLRIYDTQCGAKLMRVTDDVRSALEDPFESRWVFDVELIARYLKSRVENGDTDRDLRIREIPIRRWCDVAGSKVKPHHFAVAFFDLLRIFKRYRRPGKTFSKSSDQH